MKNIKNFNAPKYENDMYSKIEPNIYKAEDCFVTSLSFEQEPELDEGDSPAFISQYPLEDLLDQFYVHISDFYEELNSKSNITCYYEFASPDLEDIQKLRSIIGKHVYNRTITQDGENYVELVIE